MTENWTKEENTEIIKYSKKSPLNLEDIKTVEELANMYNVTKLQMRNHLKDIGVHNSKVFTEARKNRIIKEKLGQK